MKQEKLKKNDKTCCLAKGLAFRKIFGFVSITFTQTELKVVLFNESSVRLYHDLSKKKSLEDATGSVVRKINNFKKIFLYAITIRHLFGKTFPLSGTLYFTGNHTIISLIFYHVFKRKREKFVFKESSTTHDYCR